MVPNIIIKFLNVVIRINFILFNFIANITLFIVQPIDIPFTKNNINVIGNVTTNKVDKEIYIIKDISDFKLASTIFFIDIFEL